MLKQAMFIFLGIQWALFSSQAAFAAAEPAKEVESQVSMSTVLQNLHINGYVIISKVELDNGIFAIQAMTPQGKSVAVLMKAHTGEIIQPKQNPAPRVSLEDAVKRVEGSGYHDLYMVEFNGSKYVIKGLDEKNKKVKLKVNGNTGEIATSWF